MQGQTFRRNHTTLFPVLPPRRGQTAEGGEKFSDLLDIPLYYLNSRNMGSCCNFLKNRLKKLPRNR